MQNGGRDMKSIDKGSVSNVGFKLVVQSGSKQIDIWYYVQLLYDSTVNRSVEAPLCFLPR